MERVYYQDANVFISNTRAVFFGITYPRAHIVSVQALTLKPDRTLPYLLIATGVLLGAFLVQLSIIVGVLLAALFIAPGYLWLRQQRDTYTVRIRATSGEVNVITSPDLDYINRITHALNQAISASVD